MMYWTIYLPGIVNGVLKYMMKCSITMTIK